jgi:hypothetical protein
VTFLIPRLLAVAAIGAVAMQPAGEPPKHQIADRVGRLTRATEWTRVGTIPVQFRTFHPQGLVRIGDRFFVSSVEVRVPAKRLPAPVDGLDRDTGAGTGHLFQIDRSGKLIADLTLGEGALYHPGGIDYDGRHIWVTVAEYRPNSRSIVYRIDPGTMAAQEVFRFADHLGAIVHDTDNGSLHAVNWGSRTFYGWRIGPDGRVATPARPLRTANISHYVDYQDCQYVGGRAMLCTGVAELRPARDGAPVRLGGIDLIDLTTHRPLHQLPLAEWVRGKPLTQNPSWFEATADGLRGYFMPEDDESAIHVLEARAGR